MTVEDRRGRWDGQAPRMGDVSHVHAEHDTRDWHWFARGPAIAADGGRREEAGERDVEDEAIGDVDHEPVHGDGAGRVWERGDEDDSG